MRLGDVYWSAQTGASDKPHPVAVLAKIDHRVIIAPCATDVAARKLRGTIDVRIGRKAAFIIVDKWRVVPLDELGDYIFRLGYPDRCRLAGAAEIVAESERLETKWTASEVFEQARHDSTVRL